jgi:hypothetical protein
MVLFAGEAKRPNATAQSTSATSSFRQGSPLPNLGLSLPVLVNRLPGSIKWGVLFRTQALVELASGDQIGRMLGLPAGTDIARSVCVALTSAGKCLAFDAQGPWVWSLGAPPVDAAGGVADHLADLLSMLPAENADCLGFGQLPGLSPVVMALTIEGGVATGEALFERRPPEDHYELLAAVGVRSLGGEWRGRHWGARFSNRLGDHLHAGALAGFARTANCNRFFLNHGRIDETLEAGLLDAASTRVEYGLNAAIATAVGLALAARRSEMAMTCIPPAPQPSYAFGDLVPLGILAYALRSVARRAPAAEAAAILAARHLESHRVGDFWPFHRGRLPTATDSALILLGQDDAGGVDALEHFADGSGSYLPQLSNAEGDTFHMQEEEGLRHWCQPDFGTTCLVRTLRRLAGLDQRTSTALMEDWFERRAALFFANPYWVDWALALAIFKDDAAVDLRKRLAMEILASANDDGSFGRFDQPLSTALAIVALAALGYRGRTIRVAQLRLLEVMEPQGHGPVTTPFYSTRRLPSAATTDAIRGRGMLAANGQWYALSLYEDTHRMVLGAFAVLALQVPCDARAHVPAPNEAPHPRYLATSAVHYIEAFALPSYLGSPS